MSEIEETMELVGAKEPPSATNILKDAQQRRASRAKHLFIDVPTLDGDLVAEYRVLGPDEVRSMAESVVAASRNGAAPGFNDIITITRMCVGLWVRNPDGTDRIKLTDEFGHVGYDRIAKFLGKDDILKSQSDAVKYLMAERDEENEDNYVVNLVAISLHANTINRWMRDTSKRTQSLEDLLGGTLGDRGLTLDFIAQATQVGIDPMLWIKTEDEDELVYLILVAQKAMDYKERYQKQLAAFIVNNVAKLFGAKKKTEK